MLKFLVNYALHTEEYSKMIVKIVGFKVGKDRSACYYKVDLAEMQTEQEIEAALGHHLNLALKKSDFVSVRK